MFDSHRELARTARIRLHPPALSQRFARERLTAQAHGTGGVHVRSAGTAPAASVNPTVAEALREVGVDVGTEFPKPLTDDVVAAADAVVTMGCGDACPVYPGTRYLDWELDNPEGESLERVRAIRDDSDLRVRGLLATRH